MAAHTCSRPGCSNAAGALQCPVCRKSDALQDKGFFCSQECFRAAWAEHKQLHPAAPALGRYNPWPTYRFTGPLRPWPYGPVRTVPRDGSIPLPDYAASGVPLGETGRNALVSPPILRADEQDALRLVCRMAREILDEAGAGVREGATGDDIDRIVHEACLARRCYPSPLNYRGFPRSCCVSVNEVICHGIPDTRPFARGDIVNIDISVYHGGFHADVNDTYIAGGDAAGDDEARRLVQCARDVLDAAIAEVRPGVAFRDLGDVIEARAKRAGFSVVRGFCGHGVGRQFHCPPTVPHYARNKAVGTMRPGMAFTIEPMINAGTWRDELWPDNWTAVTADGRRSAQFEHTLLVTPTGVEVLTARPEERREYSY